MVFPISYSLSEAYKIAKRFGNVKKMSNLSSSSSSSSPPPSSSRPGSADPKGVGESTCEEGEVERAEDIMQLSYRVEYEERYSILLMKINQQRTNGISVPLNVEPLFN